MRLLFVTPHDPEDARAYSGTTLRMRRAFARAGADVIPFGPLQERFTRSLQALKMAYRLAGREYERFRSPVLLRGYAAQIERAARETRADVVFGASSLPLAYVRSVPFGYWIDATFDGFMGLYPQARPMSRRGLRNGRETERAALDAAALAGTIDVVKRDDALQAEALVDLALAVERRRADLVHGQLSLLAEGLHLALRIDAVAPHRLRQVRRRDRIGELPAAAGAGVRLGAGRTRRRRRRRVTAGALVFFRASRGSHQEQRHEDQTGRRRASELPHGGKTYLACRQG